MVLADQQYNTTETNIMIVFYDTSKPNGGLYLFWCDLSTEIIDNGDGTWDISSPQVQATGVNQAIIAYAYFQFQDISPEYDEDGLALPLYMDDLNLQPPSAESLPASLHLAALKEVGWNVVNDCPEASVYRMWMGDVYVIEGCYVSQAAYDYYVAGDIQVYDPGYSWQAPENDDCFVLVYFITETLFTTEMMIPVVIDKVIK